MKIVIRQTLVSNNTIVQIDPKNILAVKPTEDYGDDLLVIWYWEESKK